MIENIELVKEARKARAKAFAPYSEYSVGAALLANGEIYTGANIEVSGRSTSVHAEMLACYKAVMDSATSFEKMAISPEGESGIAPCGLCQHTIAQWTDDLLILEDVGNDKPTEYYLEDLIGPAYSPSTRHSDIVDSETGGEE